MSEERDGKWMRNPPDTNYRKPDRYNRYSTGEFHNSFTDYYNRQGAFLEVVLARDGYDAHALSEREKTELTKTYLLCLIAEALEVLNNTDWKPHVRQPERKNYGGIGEEIIDIQKYVWVLAHIWQLTPEDFLRIFTEKSDKVEAKFQEQVMAGKSVKTLT